MRTNRVNPLIFIAFILAFVLHHIFGYIGHYGYDDMEYARVAARLSEGLFDPGNHNSFRLTLVGLTAISYKLFGINDLASAIPALLVSIGTLGLIYRILRKETWPVLVFGMALFTLNNWTFFYSDKLMPDPFVAFFAFLFVYAVYSFKYDSGQKADLYWSFLAAFALFLCFNSKGTVILLAPLVGWLMITDFILKRSVKFWLQFMAITMVLIAGYFLVSEIAFGDSLVRFKAIASNSYLNACSYDQQPFSITIQRITYVLASLFLTQDMLLGFLFVLSFLFVFPDKHLFRMQDRKSFFIVSLLILMLSANFMSISVTSYSPMCPDPRHYLYIIPVAAIAAAFILNDHFNQFKFRTVLFVLVAAAFGISLLVGSSTGWKLYFPVMIAVGIVLYLKNQITAIRLFAVLMLGALLVQPADMIAYAGRVDYRIQKHVVEKEILSKNEDCVVITDEVQKRLGFYYSGFNPNAHCQFINYAEADTFHFRSDVKKILLNNWYTRYLSGLDDQDLPYFASSAVNPIFKNEELKMYIYELNNLDNRDKLFSSENDFESTYAFWNDTPDKSDVQPYSGSFSENLGEYSTCCTISLDSLLSDSISQLVVNSELMIFANKDASCNLVICMDSDGEQYFWQGFDLNKYVKSKGSWWSASCNIVFERSSIRNHSLLKVYVWNNKKNEIKIDDFEVELFSVKK